MKKGLCEEHKSSGTALFFAKKQLFIGKNRKKELENAY